MLKAYTGLIKKEFIQVRRDKNMLRIIFIVPIMQLLILGYAVNTDVKNISLDLYDYDQSHYSREFARALAAGDYFKFERDDRPLLTRSLWTLDDRFRNGSAEMALILPNDFSGRLTRGEDVTVGLVADGSDATAARVGIGYMQQIVYRFSGRIAGFESPLTMRHKFLYNPELASVYYMVPGIVATLLTMITVMLTSMAIVREREMGTLEQLLVTPISGTALLLGKITTFAILGFVEICVALIVGILWFKIPFVGSPLLLFGLSALYLVTTLGIGLFFSTVTSTQQQAMFLAWFFAVFCILTAGFFTPISNMPQWVQYVTWINPMRYFMVIVRGILMKGAGLSELMPNIYPLIIYGGLIFGFAAMRFTKRTT
ncbi:MAG: ABC transporter permease [candidate division Zixibacteria bacterium]|nr:ABC transporter permease [candidate division Zixibacteria bacterium]